MDERKDSGRRQIPLRIGSGLYNDLMAWAQDEFRSLNGQIEYILTQAVREHRKKGEWN